MADVNATVEPPQVQPIRSTEEIIIDTFMG